MSETAELTTLCPRCKLEEYGRGLSKAPRPGVSRSDNRTLICQACSEVEAALQAAGIPLDGPKQWSLYDDLPWEGSE